MMISKFRPLNDFLELKRAEIEIENNEIKPSTLMNENESIENVQNGILDEIASENCVINSSVALIRNQSSPFISKSDFEFELSVKFESESELIEMTPQKQKESIDRNDNWPVDYIDPLVITPLTVYTPPHTTNTTMIMEQLNLNLNQSEEYDKFDFFIDTETESADDKNVLESEEKKLDLDFGVDLDILISQYEIEEKEKEKEKEKEIDNNNDLDMDFLSFPMSQFPFDFDVDNGNKSRNNYSLDLTDLNNLDFDADDGEIDINLAISKSKDDQKEFDLDEISMSQFPSTQGIVSVASHAVNDANVDKREDFDFVGFKTGSGVELLPPSNEALKRVRSLVEFDDLDINFGILENGNKTKVQSNSDRASSSCSCPMFTTGNGKIIPLPSEEAIKRAKSIVESETDRKEDIDSAKNSNVNIVSFSTGRGTILPPPSEQALKKAAALLNETSAAHNNKNNNSNNNNNNINRNRNSNNSDNSDNFNASFSTARGKVLAPPSKEAMQRAISLIRSDENNISPDNKSCNFVATFSTSSGKTLPAPSDEAIKRARSIINTDPNLSVNTPFEIGRINKAASINSNLSTTRAPMIKGNFAFKPHSNSSSIIPKPFSFSTAWKRPFKPIVKSTSISIPKLKIEPVSLFDFSGTGIQRFSFKDFFKKAPENQKFSLDHYMNNFEICEEVLRLNSRTCRDFKIGEWGSKEAHKNLLELGAKLVSISLEWTVNHYRWIVWKFASLIRSFPDCYSPANLSPNYILQQLLYRYEREINQCHRSALKKIVERDDSAGKYLCLMVASVDRNNRSIELSDGWYSIWTTRLEDSFWELINDRQRILEGTKIEICGASLTGQDALPVLEASDETCACRLVIVRNSTRPARWDTKLGFVCKERTVAFLKHLHHIHPQGGQVSAISVFIDRIFPLLYKEQRNLEKKYKNKEEEEEPFHVNRSRDEQFVVSRNERDHFMYLETNSEQAYNSKFNSLQRIRVFSSTKTKINSNNNINNNNNNNDTFWGIISFWNPLNEDQRKLLQEGSKIIVTNLRTKNKTGNNNSSTLSLISTKSTRIFTDNKSANSNELNALAICNDKYISCRDRILLGKFDDFKHLKLYEYFDVTGIVLGRIGNYFWIGDRDRDCNGNEEKTKNFNDDHNDDHNDYYNFDGNIETLSNSNINIPKDHRTLVCLKNFNYQTSTGDLIYFRDLLFNQYDFKVKVAHLTFNEYSDFKKEKELKNNNLIEFNESMERFKSLTE